MSAWFDVSFQTDLVFMVTGISFGHFAPLKPITVFQHEMAGKRELCQFCGKRAICLTRDDICALTNPCYWCHSCFDAFHINSHGDLLYDGFVREDFFDIREP